MRVRELHAFGLSPAEAIRVQRALAGRVSRRGAPPRPLRTVVGVDCSITRRGELVAAAVLCRAPRWEAGQVEVASGRPGMPYVPGLLSFREAPLVLEALRRIERRPDVVIVDGQGIAHPRRLGLAAHLGLCLDAPVVGCAKSRLVGTHDELGPARRGSGTS